LRIDHGVGAGRHRTISQKIWERRVIPVSLIVAGAGLLMLPYVSSKAGILAGLAVLAIGSGINRAPTLGLLSILTPPNEQGAMQRRRAERRQSRPNPRAGFCGQYFDVSRGAPYLICAGIAVVAGSFAWAKLSRAAVKTEA